MRILLTGANGFLGNVVRQELLEYEILSMSRSKSDIHCDLSSTIPKLPGVDLVVHAAGKAHIVPKTISEKQKFYDVNVTGTQNLLMALEKSSALPKSFVFISTVAVYGIETGRLIKEDSPLLATDPYGESKIQAERIIENWCSKNNVICTVLRLPLIAGPNPPGNLKSMINGIQKGYYFNISGGCARKSIVLATDVARIIPKVAEIGGTYNLTDSSHPTFSQLSAAISKQLGKPNPSNIPSWFAAVLGKAGDLVGSKAPLNTNKLKKMTSDLTFDDSKAFQVLGWLPTPVLKGFKIK